MRAISAYLSTKKLSFLLAALFGLSVLISTAAVARGGGEPVPLYAQQYKKHSSPGRQPPPSQHSPPPEPPQTPEPAPEYKYFHEAGDSRALAHYDARFYQGHIPHNKHRTTLTHLIRSYLTTFASLGLPTWLAHGTLLGWWWSGRILPWDGDVDAQVSGQTLGWLVEGGWNQSRFRFFWEEEDYDEECVGECGEEDGERGRRRGVRQREYFLDVNAFATQTGRSGGENVIDARWIDVETGVFVDITVLSERDPDGRPGVWSCKNFHEYPTGQLFPLRETEFEGVPALVPWGYHSMLIGEYGVSSLAFTEWAGHRWEPELGVWLKTNKTEG
ncbi:LicD family-domain-containing protein [Chaetomium tenue]|uniref:LicD family-domain-containing protein n=1 Tax=Chaetomium tenue TaxID=1854479 RepID=A0ACB7NXA1_9PEZI|nr:LicD family-domain-containing protein [Chaetomium globosum]